MGCSDNVELNLKRPRRVGGIKMWTKSV